MNFEAILLFCTHLYLEACKGFWKWWNHGMQPNWWHSSSILCTWNFVCYSFNHHQSNKVWTYVMQNCRKWKQKQKPCFFPALQGEGQPHHEWHSDYPNQEVPHWLSISEETNGHWCSLTWESNHVKDVLEKLAKMCKITPNVNIVFRFLTHFGGYKTIPWITLRKMNPNRIARHGLYEKIRSQENSERSIRTEWRRPGELLGPTRELAKSWRNKDSAATLYTEICEISWELINCKEQKQNKASVSLKLSAILSSITKSSTILSQNHTVWQDLKITWQSS